MLKLKFNQNFKTIQIILNRSLSIKIFKEYIEINKIKYFYRQITVNKR